MTDHHFTRRSFLGTAAAAGAAFSIVPRHVLGGPGQNAPSDTATYAIVGNGRRNDSGIGCLGARQKIAVCDVDTAHLGGEPDNKTRYTDFRKLLERKDLDVVAIATPPHWHALVALHAARAGKDIFCEKPFTKFIAEGRAVANAVKENKVVFQIGTFQRFGRAGDRKHIENHKIIKYGLLPDLSDTVVFCGAKNRTGKTDLKEQPVPSTLDYDMWLGPAPFKPYNSARVHYSNRFYWDYEGGDLTNFGAHSVDPFQWSYAKDDTSPVRAEPCAPWPQHPDAVGKYSWAELTYGDGLRMVITGGAAGQKYDRPRKRSMVSADDLDEAGRKKLAELPDPEPLVTFGDAVRTRKQAGGNAESSHRVCVAMHLANIAIRVGRPIEFDPVKEQIVGDEEANRFVNIPMRAPWHL
jgi:hypothetical protein